VPNTPGERAEAALAEARAHLEAGDAAAAVRPLERARRDYLAADDLAGMRELRRAVEEGYGACAPADEPHFEQLLYASGQNVRFLSRRRAAAARVPWEDPHPELDDPRRPEIRAERGIRRRDVPRILVFGAIGVAAVGAAVATYVVAVLSNRPHTRAIVNDRGAAVAVGTCDSACGSAQLGNVLLPGNRWSVSTSDGWFVLRPTAGGRRQCVKVASATVRASQAGRCPQD
jgi:hypothetical protein